MRSQETEIFWPLIERIVEKIPAQDHGEYYIYYIDITNSLYGWLQLDLIPE